MQIFQDQCRQERYLIIWEKKYEFLLVMSIEKIIKERTCNLKLMENHKCLQKLLGNEKTDKNKFNIKILV